MNTYAAPSYKHTDSSKDIPTSTVESCGFSPVPHAVHFYFQLNDGNALEEALRTKQRTLNRTRGENATAGSKGRPHPHHVDDVTPPWIGEERQLGFFSSPVGYGTPNTAGTDLASRYYDQHIQLYEDVEAGTNGIARDASKTKLVIEKRETGLYRREYDHDGNVSGITPFNWHPGRTGQQYEGTLIKVQASFVKNPWKALERAEWLLEQVLGKPVNEDILIDTFRFSQPEVHIRYDRDLLYSTVKELNDAAQLVTFEQGSVESGEISSKKGRWDIWAFESSTLERLGFAKGDLDDFIDSEYIKTYILRNPPHDSDNPGYHPKLEVKIHGGFHVSQWRQVIDRANDICLTFADWAGVTAADTVADDYFRGPQSAPCAYTKPTGHREALKSFYNSDEIRYSLIGRIFREQTDAYYDILVALTYDCATGGATYQELECKTGFSYSTVTKRVGDLVDDGLLDRTRGAVSLITWANDRARAKTREVFEKTGNAAKDFVRGLAERARARIENRDRQNGHDVNTDDDRPRDEDGFLILAETTATFGDLARWYRAGDVTDEDIQFRSPP